MPLNVHYAERSSQRRRASTPTPRTPFASLAIAFVAGLAVASAAFLLMPNVFASLAVG